MTDGRSGRFGERSNHHKLTDEQVRRIRERRQRGELGTDLARAYRVSRDTIYRICNGKARTRT